MTKRQNALDVLCHSAGILLVDLFWCELHIHHGGLNLAVPHEVHQRRQAEAIAQHVPSEGMPKAVRVGFGQISDVTVMAEQGAQSRGCHAVSPSASLKDDEQG